MDIPVYLVAGFLDAGKTNFINGILEDGFAREDKTLLLCCEEGEEEYEKKALDNVTVVTVDDEDELTADFCRELEKKYRPKQVLIEYNGMWLLQDLANNLPENWIVYQCIATADGTTALTYARDNSMRSLLLDKIARSELIVFNRAEAVNNDAARQELHKLVRQASRKCDIAYEFADGSVAYDDIPDPLPFDINAPVIQVKDEDYALFYRDVSEEPKKYDGKTVSFKGQVAMLRRDKNGMFAPGRFVMTCCVEDIQFCGIPCRYDQAGTLEPRSWVMVTAKITAEKHPLYKGEVGPVLTALEVTKNAQPADPDVATF